MEQLEQLYQCIYCNKILKTKQNLNMHYDRCKVKKVNDQREKDNQVKILQDEKDNQIQQMFDENKSLKLELQKLKDEKILLCNENKQLQLQNDEHKQQIKHLQDQLVEIAKMPKTVNTHTTTNHTTTTNNNHQRTLNVTNQLATYDLTSEKVQEILGEHTLERVFIEGSNGIADFVVEKILHDPKSKKPKLVATDRSRGVFKYKDDEGNIHVDHKLKRTTDMLQKPLLEASQQVGVDILQRGEMSENLRETFTNNSSLLNCNNKHKLSSQLARRLVRDPEVSDAMTDAMTDSGYSVSGESDTEYSDRTDPCEPLAYPLVATI
jgi:hypothetical protein